MPARLLSLALSLGWQLTSASPALAQINFAAIRGEKRLEALRISEPMVIDGRLDEPAWNLAPVGRDFYQQEPDEGALATEASEIRFLYDADALYVGGTFFDSDSRGGITNELTRDFAARDGDAVSVILDTFRDLNTATFQVNPAGAQRDAQLYEDGRVVNANWDAVWWVQTARFDGGWTMEMKIPVTTLRFPSVEEQVWGMNVFRLIRRKNEVTYWSPQPRQFVPHKASYAGILTGIRGIRPGRNLQVKPFAVGMRSNVPLPALARQWDADGGVDVKYGLATSLTLDMTYRTDFSQVEADDQQINLTRFSLFFPEKREFFLENQGAFRVGDQGGGGSRRDLLPFFSRRIGLSPGGQPVPILGGARLTGRQGAFGLGLLSIQTEGSDDHAGDNFTVARVSREFGASSIGGVYLGHETPSAVGFNRVIGGDVHLNVRRGMDLYGFLLGSTSEGSDFGTAGRAAFDVSESRYTGQLSYTNISPEFRNDLGFVPRDDIGLFAWNGALHFRPPRLRRVLRTMTFGTLGERFEDSRHENLLSRRLRLYTDQSLAGGGSIGLDLDWNEERLTESFEASRGIAIPPGTYRFRQWLPALSSNRSRAISGSLGYTGGEYYSGTISGYSAGLRWRASPNLALSGNYAFNDVDLPQGQFHTNLARLRVDSSFSTRMFLNTFVQYTSASRTWLTNVRFRFTYRPLSDFYVVYNDSRPASGRHQQTLAVKHTLLLSF